MKPGSTNRRVASTTVAASEPGSGPTAVIRPSATPTSARKAGPPVPSSTIPPRITTSNIQPPPSRDQVLNQRSDWPHQNATPTLNIRSCHPATASLSISPGHGLRGRVHLSGARSAERRLLGYLPSTEPRNADTLNGDAS